MVADVKVNDALRSNNFRPSPNAGGNVAWQCPAAIELPGHTSSHFAGSKYRILRIDSKARHQLRNGPRIDLGDACTTDPLQSVNIMYAHVKAWARRPVEANTDVSDRETATGAVNRIADLALSNGLGRPGIARVEPQDMGNQKPSTSCLLRFRHLPCRREAVRHWLFHQDRQAAPEQVASNLR